MVACVTKLDKKCISMRVPSLRWTLWSFAFENTLIIQISEIQVPVLIIVPLHQWNAEPNFNLAETFSECNKLSEMKNELTDTDMLFRTGDSGAAGTAPRRDVLHGGSTETVRDVWSLTDRAPAESCHRGGWGLGDKPLPPLKEGPQKGPMRQGLLHRNYNLFMNDVHYSLHAICKFILRMHLISLHAVCTCKCFTGALHYMLYMNDLLFITCCTHYITWWVSDIHVLNTLGW